MPPARVCTCVARAASRSLAPPGGALIVKCAAAPQALGPLSLRHLARWDGGSDLRVHTQLEATLPRRNRDIEGPSPPWPPILGPGLGRQRAKLRPLTPVFGPRRGRGLAISRDPVHSPGSPRKYPQRPPPAGHSRVTNPRLREKCRAARRQVLGHKCGAGATPSCVSPTP
jgi:hypothetical protein